MQGPTAQGAYNGYVHHTKHVVNMLRYAYCTMLTPVAAGDKKKRKMEGGEEERGGMAAAPVFIY